MTPPPHFKAFDPEKPCTVYRRNLPHWRQDGATYFVTFRLHDSIPKSVTDRLRHITREKRETARDASEREWFQLFEETLDQSLGSCLLATSYHRQTVANALHYFSDSEGEVKVGTAEKEVRFRMGSFVIMSNHVHLLMQPTKPAEHPLEKILQSIKTYTATRINARDRQRGRHVWAEESYDRIVRGPEHLNRCLQYIGRNPAKAGLGPERTDRWVHPAWEAAGWKFRGNVE